MRYVAMKALCRFNGIDPDALEKFELKLTSTPITGRTRRLRAIWTVEDEQEFPGEDKKPIRSEFKTILDEFKRSMKGT